MSHSQEESGDGGQSEGSARNSNSSISMLRHKTECNANHRHVRWMAWKTASALGQRELLPTCLPQVYGRHNVHMRRKGRASYRSAMKPALTVLHWSAVGLHPPWAAAAKRATSAAASPLRVTSAPCDTRHTLPSQGHYTPM